MHKPGNDTSSANDSGQKRKEWTDPTSDRRGSVSELVQQTKISGGDDSSGAKREEIPQRD